LLTTISSCITRCSRETTTEAGCRFRSQRMVDSAIPTATPIRWVDQRSDVRSALLSVKEESRRSSVKKHKVNVVFDGIVIIGPGEPPEDVAYLDGPLFAVMPRANRQVSRYSKLYGDEPSYIPLHLPVMFTEMTPVAN